MALLTSGNIYKNPQANILYGQGSSKYTPKEIRDFIKTPGRTDDDVLGKALAEGVSLDEINKAMGNDPKYSMANMERHLSERGITKDLADPSAGMPVAARAPTPVTAGTINVGQKETMAGQMKDLLENPDNPLNVQAQTYGKQFANRRGLLNSSIAASATQDAMMKNAQPIASQDASTNYDATKSNVGNKLTADMFNTDTSTRVDMFNAGTAKDMAFNTQNRNMDYYIANMDAANKMAVAQVQAAANDSGIMGDLGKSFMNLYQQTAADPNISPEVKTQMFNTLKSQFEQVTSLLPSFQQIGKKLSFGSASNTGGTSFDDTPVGGGLLTGGTDGTGTTSAGSTPKVKEAINKVNTLDYKPEPYILAGVAAYERATGNKVDRSLVVPEQLVEDFKFQSQLGFTQAYTSKDGTNKKRNYEAYNFPELLQRVGVKDIRDLQTLFIPVHPPGTMRTDSPLFYVWNTDALSKIK